MNPENQSKDISSRYLEHEEAFLSKWGFRTRNSKGRAIPEHSDPVRTPFQRDRDRILHSKSFRRLKHKTQVFVAPEGDHFRTRMTHTLEVTQIARTIGRALGLNEDLIEAIGLGHDLGHTPFGHAGEKILDSWCKKNGIDSGFQHHLQSVRVVEVLENSGNGLNLTFEVVEGIRRHSKGSLDYNLFSNADEDLHWEGRVVKIADRIAYVNHDLQDALEARLIEFHDIPSDVIKIFGKTNRERIASMVYDIVNSTLMNQNLCMSPEAQKALNLFKDFLFDRLYESSIVRAHDDSIRRCLTALMDTLLYDDSVYEKYLHHSPGDSEIRKRKIVDYIAGMTDRYALKVASELFIPVPWYSWG